MMMIGDENALNHKVNAYSNPGENDHLDASQNSC
jgi:hypothetical protein